MDDPWGSPWASHSNTSSPTKTRKPDLEPPPRAFLSTSTASSPRPSVSGPSPWADDTNNGLGDWGGANVWDKSPRLSPNLRQDSFDSLKASPIALPGNTATAKALSGFGYPVRQPSPSLDPWANDAWNTSAEVLPTPKLVLPGLELNGLVEEEVVHAPEPVKKSLDQDEDKRGQHSVVEDRISDNGRGGEEVQERGQRPDTEQFDADHFKPKPCDLAQGPQDIASSPLGAESRAPSLSDHDDASDLEIERQDSPITSVDEDSRTRPHQGRRPSGKVQLMVEKFDGIAKKTLEEPPIPGPRERSKSSVRWDGKDDTENDVDFGEFEDADETEGNAAIPEPVVPETPTRAAARTPLPSSPISPPSRLIDMTALTSRFGPIDFSPDLAIIDRLFDTSKFDSLEPHPDPSSDPLTDRILTDSFAGISERKTWYRVSRAGSARQHDAGDLDSYRRVTWATSTVRLDTIKTVRRWMEEDSLTGRPTLGGHGGAKGNMFGWGSSEEAVDLDQVFGRKSHSRTASIQQSPPRQRKGSIIGGASPTHTRNKSSVVASFGWSTGPASDAVAHEDGSDATSNAWAQQEPKAAPPVLNGMIKPPPRAPTTATPRESLDRRSASTERDGSPSPVRRAEPVRNGMIKPPPSAPPSVSPRESLESTSPDWNPSPVRKTEDKPQPLDMDKLKAVASEEDDDDDDDDDEWGEMVSSPTDARGGFASLDAVSMVPQGVGADILSPSDTRAESSQSRTHSLGHTDAFADPWSTADFAAFEAPPVTTKPDTKTTANHSRQPSNPPVTIPPRSPPRPRTTTITSTNDILSPRSRAPTITSEAATLSPAPTSAAPSLVKASLLPSSSRDQDTWSPSSEHPFTPTTPLAVLASPMVIPSPKVIPARRSSIGAVAQAALREELGKGTVPRIVEEDAGARDEVNEGVVREIVAGLPDLRYMLR